MASTLALNAQHGNDRPPKRQRTDQDAPGAQPQHPEVRIARSDVVWKPDGDLVIRTVSQGPDELTVTHTLYRVHKPVLALHSAVLASMFDGDQAAFEVASERYEGVPVMEMPDATEDMEYFLDAMYHPKLLREHQPELDCDDLYSTPPPVFPDSYCGILRLATNYDAQDILEQVVTALTKMWPARLDDWLAVERIFSDYGRPGCREPGKYIRLAMENHISNILPAIFYELARATEAALSDLDEEMRELYEADLELLTPSELRRLIVGKVALREFVEDATRRYDSKGATCIEACRQSQCLEAARTWWKKAVKPKSPDYFETFKELEDASPMPKDVIQISQKLWEALAELFGISDDDTV
ncbi:hypothetical protein FA95DRAFT_1607279 [Auriscalpium vulgare]|uniref:Uncharacterized protein n=1 Tax=Auriscalpium vulgare TaxID=40419 RepID=A0ACB8RQH9_9AGAM|nr:hypothetical protein FA95DRAFT_1607279 [Auriscalpium vulgare]